jgi:predicted PurR-regulated permease PerM
MSTRKVTLLDAQVEPLEPIAAPAGAKGPQNAAEGNALPAGGEPASASRKGLMSTYRAVPPPLMALAIFALVGAALAILRSGSAIISPIILALFMVTLALPAARWLKKRGVGGGLTLLILFVGMLLIGLGLALLAYLYVARLTQGLGEQGATLAADLKAQLGTYVSSSTSDEISRNLALSVARVAAILAGVIVGFVYSAVLAAFLLVEAPRFGRLLRTSMNDLPFIGLTPEVMDVAIRYFMIRLRLNVMTGLVFGVFLWLIGIPYAPLWAILTVVLSFVPYVGLVIAAAPAVILAFAQYGWPMALLVIVAVTVINFTVENVAAPAMTGKGLSLSPAIVFVAFAFWVWLLGPIGALVAMPITVLLMLTFAGYESTRWVAQIIGHVDVAEKTAEEPALQAASN